MEKIITKDTLDKINEYSVKELSAEDIFTFEVILCDNDIDRDYEKFTEKSLEKLGELFKGKTGIFDHNPRCENQSARIYETEVVNYADKKTTDGQPLLALKGYAYMIRTEDNRDFIKEIEGGIKKEISVSCSVEKKICSICGADENTNPCIHSKSRIYDGKLCYFSLENPLDAYEWSFVAVPAQKNAGVVKKCFCSDKNNDEKREKLQKEILALSYFAKPFESAGNVSLATKNLDIESLEILKENLERQTENYKTENDFFEVENQEKFQTENCYKI